MRSHLDASPVRRELKSRKMTETRPLRVGHGFISRLEVKKGGDTRSWSLCEL